jgi:hypothetical protein
VLLDFKRSDSSIPTATQIKNFEKIQLWFYLNVLRDSGLLNEDTKFLIGYICLTELESSKLFSNTKFDPITFGKKSLKVSEIIGMNEYLEFENEKTQNLFSLETFHPSPREKNVCNYCSQEVICSKGINRV